MTISGIGGASQMQATNGVDPSSWQTQMQQTLGPVAQLFGESTQQLTSDLQSGNLSLSQLADSKGISQSDLLSAIQQGLQQSAANGGAQLSDTQLTNFAHGIAGRVHGGHHHHHGGGGKTSSAADATDATGTTDPLGAIQQDLQQLLSDLGSLEPNSSTGAAGSTGIDQLS